MEEIEFNSLWMSLSGLSILGSVTVVLEKRLESKIRKGIEERYGEIYGEVYLCNVKLIFV